MEKLSDHESVSTARMRLRRWCLVLITAILLCFLPAVPASATPLSSHGALSVKGRNLVDKKGKVYQLKGVSTHGLAWYPEYVNKTTFRYLRDKWHVNVIRLAMYTQEYGGYVSGGDKAALEKKIDEGVAACSRLGMYCIIDWHILSDGDPLTNKDAAKTFFTKMAKKYGKKKNVLYEICNEPNGSGGTWQNIRSYANTIIPVIRKYAPKAVILVGTPTWSQDVDQAAADPLKGYSNIMYTLHFYAGTHREYLRDKLENALKAGLPVFISEFSITDASGNGNIDKASAESWKKLIGKYKLSYCAWSLSNKDESSALLKSSTKKLSNWSNRELSETGKWIRKMLK